MKNTINAKIGTHSSTVLVLWKAYTPGDKSILAMKLQQWNNSHWSYRRLKSCSFWKTYYVDQELSRNDFLFLFC